MITKDTKYYRKTGADPCQAYDRKQHGAGRWYCARKRRDTGLWKTGL